MGFDLRARLRSLGPGHYDVLCGKPNCRGWLGRVFAAGAPIPVPKFPEFDGARAPFAEWWPPSGFAPGAGVWGLTRRAARQYREQRRRLGRGVKPKDRPASEPASWGRRLPPSPPDFIPLPKGVSLKARLDHLMAYFRRMVFLPRSGNLYPRLPDPFAALTRDGRQYSSPRRHPDPDPETRFPFRVTCPDCGWRNVLEAPPPLTDSERSSSMNMNSTTA